MSFWFSTCQPCCSQPHFVVATIVSCQDPTAPDNQLPTLFGGGVAVTVAQGGVVVYSGSSSSVSIPFTPGLTYVITVTTDYGTQTQTVTPVVSSPIQTFTFHFYYTALPSCLCFCFDTPTSLRMTSDDPGCNFKMFQSCTIQWGATPSALLPTQIGVNSFLSTEGFPDPVAGGAIFFYYLTCQFNVFSLSRVYPTSPYGSPYLDGVLYTWLIGGLGNTCDPFRLDNGTAFPGSDLSCKVRIDGA